MHVCSRHALSKKILVWLLVPNFNKAAQQNNLTELFTSRLQFALTLLIHRRYSHKYGSEEIRRSRKMEEVFYTKRMRIHEKAFEWNMAHIISFCLPDRAVCHGQERARESGLSGQTISCAFPSGWIDIRILQAITRDNCKAYWILGYFHTVSFFALLCFFHKIKCYHMQSMHI